MAKTRDAKTRLGKHSRPANRRPCASIKTRSRFGFPNLYCIAAHGIEELVMVTAASRDVMPGFAFNDAFPNLSNGVAAAVAETGV
ncbi:hypothetical protein VSDG_05429 [Cytospora chrysosperma]|uniref:Uncharacterized protein n=1 Tax=Cytospora chrysosperma TaxID=252740 RepID=A0A423VZ93_CYTCH|nr:hypothetical protein VSDG_05429 [Valsa sordida]